MSNNFLQNRRAYVPPVTKIHSLYPKDRLMYLNGSWGDEGGAGSDGAYTEETEDF